MSFIEVLTSGVLFSNILNYDFFILLAGIGNALLYNKLRNLSGILYAHFSKLDHISTLSEKGKSELDSVGKEDKILTKKELMHLRENMNKAYAYYYNITALFPLLGMLGTVFGLIPLVNSIGEVNMSSFFIALTSTFWGISFSLIYKFLDSTISYKIEEIEKRMSGIK